MAHHLDVILFDLDGVLVDSREATARFFQDILEARGYIAPSNPECDAVYHLPAAVALARLSEEKDPVRLGELTEAVFSERYPLECVQPEVDASTVLHELAESYRLGVVSSRIRDGVSKVLDRAFDPTLFEVVIGFEDTREHKPDAAPLLEAAKRLGVDPTKTAYVGDSESDVIAARAAGALPIMYGSALVLDCRSISQLRHLPDLLEREL